MCICGARDDSSLRHRARLPASGRNRRLEGQVPHCSPRRHTRHRNALAARATHRLLGHDWAGWGGSEGDEESEVPEGDELSSSKDSKGDDDGDESDSSDGDGSEDSSEDEESEGEESGTDGDSEDGSDSDDSGSEDGNEDGSEQSSSEDDSGTDSGDESGESDRDPTSDGDRDDRGEDDDGDPEESEKKSKVEKKPDKGEAGKKGSKQEHTAGESEEPDFLEEPVVAEEDKADGMTPEQRKEVREALKQAIELIESGAVSEKDISAMSDVFVNKLNSRIKSDVYAVDPKVRDTYTQMGPSNFEKGQQLIGPGLALLGPLATKLRYLFTSRESQKIQGSMTKGPRLDGKNLHKAVTGRKGRNPPVFAKKQRHRNEDAVVSILVDNSSSMHSGRKSHYTELMCTGLGTTLQRMNVPFEMMGFTTQHYGSQVNGVRTSPVVINVIKSFEEKKFLPERAVFFSGANGNSDMEVGKIMVDRLKERPEPKKVYFVISDGQPASNGYHNYNNLYRRFLQATKDSGIHVFGFGLGSAANIEYFFGEDDSVTIDLGHVEEFPHKVLEKLTKILGKS